MSVPKQVLVLVRSPPPLLLVLLLSAKRISFYVVAART
jgi:hypothetical protein